MNRRPDCCKEAGRRRVTARRAVVWAICAFGWLAAARPSLAANPDALWDVVHGLCVTDEMTTGFSAPCTAVDLAGGYAVLKDLRGATQFLVIPTERITGIESPLLLAPKSPNYWSDAWRARRFIEQRLGRSIPRDDIGLAVNSRYGRSQEQLHIHVDCVRPDVRRILDANARKIGRRWTRLKVPLAGHFYRAMRIERRDLGTLDPFKLLAESDPGARADMGRETLAVIGASFPNARAGFFILSDGADFAKADQGSAEELLDHACKILGPSP